MHQGSEHPDIKVGAQLGYPPEVKKGSTDHWRHLEFHSKRQRIPLVSVHSSSGSLSAGFSNANLFLMWTFNSSEMLSKLYSGIMILSVFFFSSTLMLSTLIHSSWSVLQSTPGLVFGNFTMSCFCSLFDFRISHLVMSTCIIFCLVYGCLFGGEHWDKNPHINYSVATSLGAHYQNTWHMYSILSFKVFHLYYCMSRTFTTAHKMNESYPHIADVVSSVLALSWSWLAHLSNCASQIL